MMSNYVPRSTWDAANGDLDNAEVHLRLWLKEVGYQGEVVLGINRADRLDYFDFDLDKPSGVFLVLKDEVGTINDNHNWLKKFRQQNPE